MADDELSLIRIKQDRRGLASAGVQIGETDWPLAARAMGWQGGRARTTGSLRKLLAAALRADGPSLIEARIDPAGYGDMLEAIRG